MILAIDPGPTESAFVKYEPTLHRVTYKGKWPNHQLLNEVRRAKKMAAAALSSDVMVVEMIASYGMPVGVEIFETCVMIGCLVEAWGGNSSKVTRGAVKLQICGTARAKDGNVRQALIDRFGGDSHAIGKKAKPGPLYGVSGDVWAALAVAVTYAERTKMAEGQVAA